MWKLSVFPGYFYCTLKQTVILFDLGQLSKSGPLVQGFNISWLKNLLQKSHKHKTVILLGLGCTEFRFQTIFFFYVSARNGNEIQMCQNHFHTQYILDKCADKTLMLLRLACKEFRFQTNPSFYVCAQLQRKDPEIHREIVECTDYGRQLLGLGKQIGQIHSKEFGSLVHVFHYSTNLYTKICWDWDLNWAAKN